MARSPTVRMSWWKTRRRPGRNDCAIFDFMPIGEDYKYDWAAKEAKVTTYVVPCSLPGRILVAWRQSRFGAMARHLVRLRPADLPRVLRKRFSGRSPAP